MDLTKIDLRKEKVINLKKEAGIVADKAQVVLVLDRSGSMKHLYTNGTVQDTVERILPLGLAFDDNGEVDTYIFGSNYSKINSPITRQNLEGYVNTEINNKHSYDGDTKYAPVLNAIKDEFKPKKSGGLFGFGGKDEPMEYPVYIIFITDGENSDKDRSEKVIREMSQQGFFIQFIGIGRESFSFLSKLDDLDGRLIDNANFFKVQDINSMSDDTLYKGIMAEYPGWSKQARSMGLIK